MAGVDKAVTVIEDRSRTLTDTFQETDQDLWAKIFSISSGRAHRKLPELMAYWRLTSLQCVSRDQPYDIGQTTGGVDIGDTTLGNAHVAD